MSTVKTDNVVGSFTPLPVVNSANAVETYLATAGQTVFTTTKFDQTSAIKVFAKATTGFTELTATWTGTNTVAVSGITLTAGQKVYVYSVGDATLRKDLNDPAKGTSLTAWKISKLNKAITTAGDALNHLEVPLWSFADKAVGYAAGGDPSTWDWAPAIIAANAVIDTLSPNGGCIVARAGTYGIGSQATITGLGKSLKGHGIRATEFHALPSYTGDIIVFSGSSYCKASDFKIVGSNGASQRGLYIPYRVDSGVTLENRIDSVQVESVAEGIALENPVHCTVIDVRTDRNCMLFGLRSQFIAGVGAGQGGTNLRLIGGWFQANETTGTSCYINSNTSFSSQGTQYEHGRYGLVLRACPGATVISPLFEDCGMHISLQGCTNTSIIGPNLDSGTTPNLNIAVQPLIDIDGGTGIKIVGLYSYGDDKTYISGLIRFSNSAYGVYPDDVLIDTYTSLGAKGLINSANCTKLRIYKGGAISMGGSTLSDLRVQLKILTAAPASPALGEVFNADGVLWQPVPGGRSMVIYAGSGVYTKIVNF